MRDEDFIRLAIQEARNSETAGGAPIGAVMVKDGKVIAKGWSLVWPEKDPTAHAETNCIKAACKALQSLDLSGCTLYSTLESCSMCLGCGGWSQLSKVVFGAYKEDVDGNPYELKDYHAMDHAKNIVPPIQVIGGVLRQECKELMKDRKNWAKI